MSDGNEGLDIAIIGMAGKFPGANDIDAFWKLLKDGVEAITYFSDEELEASGINPALIRDPNYVKSRCIIEDEDKFDAHFFDLSARESEILDPQHRLFLEIAWQALEDAGYHADGFDGLIGLFGGVSLNTYLYSFLMAQKGFISSAEGYQLSIGNDKDFLTTRVSYKMNLTGPSVDVQTACSTSLVAVHMASQNLLNFNCDMAMAGGVSITIPQKQGYYYQEGMILSSDGHCRAFDEKASGTISGSGSGIVVLKRLDEALEDGDHIYGVIKGSSYNNDGSMRVGYTAPSVDGQSEVIANAQAIADIDPETITYIEAHGTGTVLGDPIEISALTQVFREHTQKNQYCAVGSVKTNIGHLDAAAGVAGLIKTALALHHKTIPPSLNFEKPNPKIDFENSPFFVNNQLREWHNDNGPLRAGISSFGIGGTNAHAVLEEAPQQEKGSPSRPHQLLLLSAKTKTALDARTDQLQEYLEKNSRSDLADVAFTLHVGRKPMQHRRMFTAVSGEEALSILKKRDPRQILSASHAKEPSAPPVVFMFSGQGAQYVNMGRELYEQETIFRESVDECCAILNRYMEDDLRTIIYPEKNNATEATEKLKQTAVTQPALFVIEYALARLLRHWGLEPQAMVGHSIGEYVAACISGVFSLEDALAIVVERGRLMQEQPAGAMISLRMDEADVKPLLDEQLSIAALNAPEATVVSGPFEAIEILEKTLEDKKIQFRRLHTSHAFHSTMMEPMLEPFKGKVAEMELHEPQMPYVSNVTGTWITVEEATDPDYYARHVRSGVRFMDNIQTLLENEQTVLVEVGPGTTLSALARRHPANTLGRVIVSTLHHPSEEQSDEAYLLSALGRLWLAGVQPDWNRFYENERRLRLSLPAYPFERQRYWLESKGGTVALSAGAETQEGKNSDLSQWFYLPAWRQRHLPFTGTAVPDEKQQWLCIHSGQTQAERLVQKLNAMEQEVGIAETASHFQKNDQHSYAINPAKSDDFGQLLTSLNEDGFRPDHIVWFLADDYTVFSENDDPAEAWIKPLIYLGQAIIHTGLVEPLHLTVVGKAFNAVLPTDAIRPDQATLLGGLNVLAQELPSLSYKIIDTDTMNGAGNDQPHSEFTEQLIAEFMSQNDDLNVAYRGKQRWIQQFDRTPLETAEPLKGLLRQNGVYVITGGLGRIALNLADYLGKTVGAHLALLEPKTFPERTQWQAIVDKGDDARTVEKIRKLQTIEQNGGTVRVIEADVSDATAMKKAFNAVKQEFGAVHGVVHAAGKVGEETIKTWSEINSGDLQAQFAAKINGTRLIAELLRTEPLDFVLLQSSISTVLGGLGFAAYAAANRFMDAFAAAQDGRNGARWISVNWDAWKFGEQEEESDSGIGSELAELSITPQEGVQAFERIFSVRGLQQVVVSTANLQNRLEKWVKRTTPGASASEKEAAEGTYHSRPNLPTEFVEPQNDLQKEIAAVWQKLLGVEPIGLYDDFFDLGGNSLMGTQLISQLREQFRTELPLRSLFDDPTIAGVAQIIEQERAKTEDKDTQAVTNLLEQMEHLSEEEAARLLEEKKKKNGNQ